MIGQTESVSEKLASFFGFTKAKTQLSLFGDDECGANGPGGHGFQPGNVCGGKSKKGQQSATVAPSQEKPQAVDRRTRREQIMDEIYLRMRDLNDEDGDPEEYIADDERAELDALDGHTQAVDSPPEKPSTAEVNRSESLFENQVGTDPNPNAVASATSEQLVESSSDSSDKDYIYARKSDVRNAGEDLAMSRRHIANMWKETIESATDDQRAKLLTKANMMRNEPHLLAESWTPEDGTQKGLVHAAVALSLNKFPGSAYDGKYVASAGEDARRKSQDQYVESWRMIKAKGEELARTETDPDAAVVKLRTFVADRIQKLRADDSKYNPHANQLVDMYKGMVLGRYKKTGVGSQLQDLQSAGPEKLHDAIAGVLENKTVAAALGVKGTSKGAKPKVDLDNLRNFYNADSSERIGGRAVSVGSNPRDVANHLIENIGFRGVQHGNYVPDDERVFHMKATAEACADLLDVTGLRERDLTFDGKLGIAFGARGAGRGALAHYEPTTVVVNITRKSGSGALAHEWGHFFDHMVGDLYEAESGQTNPIGKDTAHYLSDKTKRGDKYHEVVGNKLVWHDRPANPVIDAMRGIQKAVVDSGFKKRLGEEITKARREGLSAPKAEYWRSDREVFARSFESWVQHALRVQGRKNDYLTSLASNGGMWPTRKEIEAMAPAFESLMAAHRQHNLKTDKAKYSDSDRTSLAKSLFSRSLAEFFGFTKESACGANGPGGQGFQPGNTCAAEEGDGDEIRDLIPEDGPSQHPDIFHNLKTDPTKQDRADLLEYAKDIATFRIRDDSLLKKAITQLTTDPTKQDRKWMVQYAGEVLTLKPVRDFLTGKNIGPDPTADDIRAITGGVKKVVNATVGNLVRLVGENIEQSRQQGPSIPDKVNNHRVPMMIRSFTKAVDTDGQDKLIEQITDEVLRRSGDYTDADVVQEAILDVMEEVLSGEFPETEQTVDKSGGISGTTGSAGGFLQGKRAAVVESDWLNHEFDPDDYDPPERDR